MDTQNLQRPDLEDDRKADPELERLVEEAERLDAQDEREGFVEQTIYLVAVDGASYLGRFIGRQLVEEVYLLRNGDVLLHDENGGTYEVVDPSDPDLASSLDILDYIVLCDALGRAAVVDLPVGY